MNLLEKALEYTRQELTKKYRCKAVSEEEILDDIQDCMEQFGQDNDLPEGWWMSYGGIHDIFVMLQEHVNNMFETPQQTSTIMGTIKLIISIASNWRIDALTLMYALTLLLAVADVDNFALLVSTKITAVILGYLTIKLSKSWDKEGYLKELEVFNDNEEED
jgi:hypothetical protein